MISQKLLQMQNRPAADVTVDVRGSSSGDIVCQLLLIFYVCC